MYSRRAKVEEKRNIKKAYIYVLLSIITVIFLFFLGLPVLIKFAGIFTNLGKADKPVDITDITPPAPPQFEQIPEYTNKSSLKITGKSEDGAIIVITYNGDETETVANNEGVFSFDINLNDGENTFYSIARDQAGNVSQETTKQTITFDNEKPKLSIDSPKDGDTFYGATQRQISIKGITDTSSDLYINDRYVTVSDDGSFSYSSTLNEGSNQFNVKSVDKAGNEESTSLTLNFTL